MARAETYLDRKALQNTVLDYLVNHYDKEDLLTLRTAIARGMPDRMFDFADLYNSEVFDFAPQITKEEAVIALESIVDPISLNEPVYSDGGDTIFVMDQIGSSESDEDWLNEISIKEAISNLGEREKQILNLRFIQGKTQMEVAQEIGISQAQVSRLEKGALQQIRREL